MPRPIQYIPVERNSLHHSDRGAGILSLQWLSPDLCAQDTGTYPPYSVTTNSLLMVACTDGNIHLVNTGLQPSAVTAHANKPHKVIKSE